MKTTLLLFLWMILTAFAAPLGFIAHAEEISSKPVGTVTITDEHGYYRLSSYAEVFEDSTGRLTLDEINSDKYSARFSPLSVRSTNMGYTSSAIWLRCRISDKAPETPRWILLINDARIAYVDFYLQYAGDSLFAHRRTGRLEPLNSRDADYNKFVLNVPLVPGKEQIMFLRFRSDSAVNVSSDLLSYDNFVRNAFRTRLFLGAYIGALLIMIGYHFFLYISLRDKMYLYFAAFMTAFFLYQSAREGLAQQYFWSGAFNSFGLCLFGFLGLAFGLQCAASFMQTKTNAPLQHKILTVFTIISFVGAALSTFWGGSAVLLTISTPIVILIIFSTTLVLWRRGFSAARYLLIVPVPAFAAFFHSTLTDLGLLQSGEIVEYYKWIGIWVLALGLSAALADRIVVLAKEEDKARRRFRLAWETSPDYFSISRLRDGLFVDVNAGFSKLTGYDASEVIGKCSVAMRLWKDPERRHALVSQLLKNGYVEDFRTDFVRKDGETRKVSISAGLMNLDDERHFLATVKDIEENERIVKELAKSEERFRKYFELGLVGMSMTSPEKGWQYVNRRLCEMLGYTKDELLQTTWEALTHPDDLDRNLELFNKLMSGEIDGFSMDKRLIRKDGTLVYITLHVACMRKPDGTVEHLIAHLHDVTERKRFEQALEEQLKFLETLLNAIPSPVCYKDVHGKYLGCNRAFERWVGVRRQDLLGRTVHDITAPEFAKMVSERDSELLAHPGIRNFETPDLHSDGLIRDTLVSKATFESADGEVTGLITIITDVTAIKSIKMALAQSEAKYRAMFQHMQSGVAVYDAIDDGNDFIFRDFNASAERISRIPRERVIGKSLLSVFPKMREAGLFNALQRVYRTGNPENIPVFYYEDEFRCGWRENFIYRLPSGEVVAIYNDVTDRKIAEDTVRRRTEELEAINRLGNEIGANLSLEEMVNLGLAVISSVLGCDCAMLFLKEEAGLVLKGFVPDSELHENIEFPNHKIGECLCGLSARDSVSIFSSDINSDPRCTWTECRSLGLKSIATVPLTVADEVIGVLGLGSFKSVDFSEQRDFIHSMAHQLTMGLKNALLFQEVQKHSQKLEIKLDELKQANEAREALQSQLLQAQKMEAIGRLSGGIAHDFNNLLTVMTGYSDMLRGQFPEGSPQADKLAQIRNAADRAAGLTGRLLAFSRKQVLEMKVIDLNHVLSEMEKMLGRLLGEDVELQTNYRASPALVTADQTQIWQVVMNLVVNARDALLQGGKLTIETANTVLDAGYARSHAEVEPGPYVMMAVSDNGAGMNAEVKAHIFEPFFTTKEKGVGTGLGLSTVFGIVKQHHGHVSVYSERGRGSTFTIYFPQSDGPIEQRSESVRVPIIPRACETVLVVEDEKFVRNYACEVLESLGYTTFGAKSPGEAFEISEGYDGAIHLLLTDVVLPMMDGKSLFEKLHSARPQMLVLYMSGYADDAIVHHGVLDSGVHFIQKPFTVDGLAKKISQVFGRADPVSADESYTDKSSPQEMQADEVKERLATLPAELLQELNRAALEAGRAGAVTVVDEIGRFDEELAELLRAWINRFRFDRIVAITEKQVVQNDK